ncbi:hypothetical protein BJX62DRAFT_238138 [Aspergillus germanicus]
MGAGPTAPEHSIEARKEHDEFLTRRLLKLEHGHRSQFMNLFIGGRTPLHRALDEGKQDAILERIDAGADVLAVDAYGHTALHDAVRFMADTRVIERLIQA